MATQQLLFVTDQFDHHVREAVNLWSRLLRIEPQNDREYLELPGRAQRRQYAHELERHRGPFHISQVFFRGQVVRLFRLPPTELYQRRLAREIERLKQQLDESAQTEPPATNEISRRKPR